MKTPLSTPALILALLASACSSPSYPVATPELNTPAVITSSVGEATRLQFDVDPPSIPSFAGVSRGLTILAFDQAGNRVNSSGTLVTISDPSMASHTVIPLNYQDGNPPGARVNLWLRRVGTFQVTATYGSATHSVAIEVLPDPPLSTDLVIDSFYVVEYRETCVAWDCPYLVYAPTFQLRAANGAAPVTLRGVELSIGSRPKYICKDNVPFLPSQSRRFSGVDPYLWNNPLVLVSVDGKPFPEATASLRLFIQGADGSYSVVEGSGPIHRESPLTETPGLPTWEWSC